MFNEDLMTLEGAIEHSLDIVRSATCDKCKKNHRQLALWLKELKEYRDKNVNLG